MNAPKPGDRVRVTFDATWSSTWTVNNELLGHILDDGGRTFSVVAGATVEVLASPVYVNHDTAEYWSGDVVRSASGYVLAYRPDIDEIRPWLGVTHRHSHGFTQNFDLPSQPLTLLVRHGQVIAP